ncbi:PorP/SprF family type IX secretion system membrane protein [candidate division KSB1 bacterium]
MTRKHITIILIMVIIQLPLIQESSGQDIHFSQFNNAPLNLNPANTGFFLGTSRVVLNHRNQWSSVTIPYSTFSAGIDMQVFKRKFFQDIFGAGIVINRDKAGDSEFGTTQANLSFSYIKALNRKNNHFVSVGVQTGIAQRSINYSQLVFDNQYNGDLYDPNLYHGEQFSRDNFWFADISAGMHWYYQAENRLNFNAGIGGFHLNTPKQSLFNDGDVNLDSKLIIYGNSQSELSNKMDLLPGFMLAFQGPYTEIIYGTQIKFILDKNKYYYSAINAGIYIRHNDAVIALLGLDYRKFSIGLSYDVNISGLKAASNYMGGFEISAIYIFNKSKNQKIKEVPCPIF